MYLHTALSSERGEVHLHSVALRGVFHRSPLKGLDFIRESCNLELDGFEDCLFLL
jgi:hypothetical protein